WRVLRLLFSDLRYVTCADRLGRPPSGCRWRPCRRLVQPDFRRPRHKSHQARRQRRSLANQAGERTPLTSSLMRFSPISGVLGINLIKLDVNGVLSPTWLGRTNKTGYVLTLARQGDNYLVGGNFN